MYRKLCFGVCLPLLTCFLAACASGVGQTKLPRDLGVEMSEGTVLMDEDTHGGFHGDGQTLVEILFDDPEALAARLAENGDWQALPLTENLQTAVYGSATVGSLVWGWGEEDEIPAIENGYYYFHDRHSESKDPKSDRELFSRYSYNFTIALYDADSGHLYYYKLDT